MLPNDINTSLLNTHIATTAPMPYLYVLTTFGTADHLYRKSITIISTSQFSHESLNNELYHMTNQMRDQVEDEERFSEDAKDLEVCGPGHFFTHRDTHMARWTRKRKQHLARVACTESNAHTCILACIRASIHNAPEHASLCKGTD